MIKKLRSTPCNLMPDMLSEGIFMSWSAEMKFQHIFSEGRGREVL